MKKNLLIPLILLLSLLCLASGCNVPGNESATPDPSDVADTTGINNEKDHLKDESVGGLDEGGANPTDNVSLIESEGTPSPSPVVPGDDHGIVDDLGTAASDAIDDVREGIDDLTTPGTGILDGTSGSTGSNVIPGAGVR